MNKTEHLLTCLIEECSEIQKEAAKALRFGLDDKWKSDINTAEKIAIEFGDLLGVFEMLKEECLIPILDNDNLIQRKKQRVLKYMSYAINRKTLVLVEDV